MTLRYLKRISAGKVFICLITNPIKFSMTFKLMIYIVVMINHGRIRMCLYEFIKDEKRSSYITHWHLDNKESITITWTCEFIWFSKWFWRLLMEQRKWRKEIEFTMVLLWMIYVYCSQMLLHVHYISWIQSALLSCIKFVSKQMPLRDAAWHSSYRLCCWKNWASIFNYVFEVVEGALVFKVLSV